MKPLHRDGETHEMLSPEELERRLQQFEADRLAEPPEILRPEAPRRERCWDGTLSLLLAIAFGYLLARIIPPLIEHLLK
jgi:ferric-dicitrate binding protein FerR (iron transport regulator)